MIGDHGNIVGDNKDYVLEMMKIRVDYKVG
jgi:hypothetical protein